MKVTYLWKNKGWRKNRAETGHWIGTSDVKCIFENFGEVENIYGSFAAVKESKESVLLINDLIGSYPLFYCVKQDNIFISDDAKLIADQIKARLKVEDVAEFWKTGYITENETLFNDVYGLNPGTFLEIDKINGVVKETEWFHISYVQKESNVSEEEKISKFDDCLHKVFADLIERLRGRTALLPLSGGLDSRLVAVYFKKLGYENVSCFSYGRKGNWEAAKSQKIASQLGYKWIFEEYSADRWNDLICSEEYEQFLEWSCRGRSIGCLQALPAILGIKEKHLVSDDAVVIPGHALDFTLGSHITESLTKARDEDVVDYILDGHYILTDRKSYAGVEKWKSKVKIGNPVNAYMQWEYRNRQSKFIANDVRTYEYAGFDFELPLWDSRIQEFAMTLSLDDLIDRKFQREFTRQVIDPLIGLEDSNVRPELKSEKWIKTLLKKNILIKKYLENKDIKHRRFNDTNGFLSWLTEEEYRQYSNQLGRKFNINSIVANDYINSLMEAEK